MVKIKYTAGYKYQLNEDYTVATPIVPQQAIDTHFIKLTMDGVLTVRADYAWDGPSGPTIDTPDFMRGSLVHDALYQLMRERHLDYQVHRKPADRLLRALCIEDGMKELRANAVYDGVRIFGEACAKPREK